jgi:hypothetical protein
LHPVIRGRKDLTPIPVSTDEKEKLRIMQSVATIGLIATIRNEVPAGKGRVMMAWLIFA